MSALLKTAGLWGSIVTLVLLLIALIRQLMAFIGFLTFMLKAGLVIAFAGVFLLVAFMIWRDYQKRKRERD